MGYLYPTSFSGLDIAEKRAIDRVLASGQLTMGRETLAFEEEIAAFNRRRYAVAFNSGSSANLAATMVLQPTVAAVPALAWGTTYSPLMLHGCKLQLIDADDSWCAAPWRASAVDFHIACSILGNPASEMHLMNAALNDDCEAVGATIGTRPTGSYGKIATQSYFWSHQMNGIELGAALTDDFDLACKMRILRDHGLDRSVNVNSDRGFDHEYNFIIFGFNLRPIEMHCAVARAQLKKVRAGRETRWSNWCFFYGLTRDLPIMMPNLGQGANPFGVHFEVENKEIRGKLAVELRRNGIDCRLPTGGSFTKHPMGRKWKDQPTPRADRIHNTGMFLGNAARPIESEIALAVDVMRKVLNPKQRSQA